MKGRKMELKDTVDGMLSADYRERFVAEMQQVRIRHDKLHDMLWRWNKGELDFEPDVPYSILQAQCSCMAAYLHLLVTRAGIEGIDFAAAFPEEEE